MRKEDLIKCYAYAEVLWQTFKMVEDDKNKSQLQDILWYDFLKDYELEVIFAGMRELARESDFCNIVKISKECEIIKELLKNEDTAEKVWNDFLKDLPKITAKVYKIEYPYYSVKDKQNCLAEIESIFEKFNSPLKSYLGGIENLKAIAKLDNEQLMFEKNRFLKNYKEIKKNTIIRDNLLENTKEIFIMLEGGNDI